MTPLRVIATIKFFLYLLWPAAVMAGPLTFGQAVQQVTGLEWMLLAVLTTLAGVTALLIRVSAHINDAPDGVVAAPIRNLYLLVSAHMCGSWLAGIVAFFLAAHLVMPGYMVGFFVPIVSFGGARSLEVLYNKYVRDRFGAKAP